MVFFKAKTFQIQDGSIDCTLYLGDRRGKVENWYWEKRITPLHATQLQINHYNSQPYFLLVVLAKW